MGSHLAANRSLARMAGMLAALVTVVALSGCEEPSEPRISTLPTDAPSTTVETPDTTVVPASTVAPTSTTTPATTTVAPTTAAPAAPPTTRRPTTTAGAAPTTLRPTTLPPPVTAPPPTAAPAQGNCHPSYTPCVPYASDVDCAGGSGNGPEYTGRVEVIGPDVYDLDRDGDGIGCDDS